MASYSMGETGQAPTQTSVTVNVGPPLEILRSMVSTRFLVRDAFLDPYGVPTVLVAAEPPRNKFKSLLEELKPHGLLAAIRGSGDTLTIKIFQRPQMRPPRRLLNLALFLATVGTVLFSGYYLWEIGPLGIRDLQQRIIDIIEPGSNPYVKAGLFAGALLAIIGLHEFGHKTAAWHHNLDATLPYFIPGPPPVGTFGALISLRGPPKDRDQLFDLGISGPAVGFAVTIVVAALSVLLGVAVSQAKLVRIDQACQSFLGQTCLSSVDFGSWPSQPAILILVTGLAGFLRTGVLFDSQLFVAAQIGALLTFLNIVPAWQLDGGHISRALFGPRNHRRATVVGLLILLVSGFWPFALLIVVMMSFSRAGASGVEPLDDVSPVSDSRKILYFLALAMLVLTFSPIPFSFL